MPLQKRTNIGKQSRISHIIPYSMSKDETELDNSSQKKETQLQISSTSDQMKATCLCLARAKVNPPWRKINLKSSLQVFI